VDRIARQARRPGGLGLRSNDETAGSEALERPFPAFYAEAEPILRVAFAARYGVDRGAEATAEALAYAWQHWARVSEMEHPVAYLFRAGQSRSRRIRRPSALFPPPSAEVGPGFEPGLPSALALLTERQRVCVVLAHGYGLAHTEIGRMLEIAPSSVQNHIERAMTKPRDALEVTRDV